MPRPSGRTRSKKRVYRSLPGGGRRIHYKQEVVGLQRCSLCGQPLAGVQHASVSALRKLNRTRGRVCRPYGGQICHNCLKKSLRQATRSA